VAKRALFISDLHLAGERPETNEQFFRFLQEEAPRADALYVLGDLFECWAGDDELTDREGDPLAAEVARGFRALTDAGVKVHVMHGNRDFLVGRGFLGASGARLLDDPSVIKFAGKRLALLHGDSLCTDDHDYQAWRRRCVGAGNAISPGRLPRAVRRLPGCGKRAREPSPPSPRKSWTSTRKPCARPSATSSCAT
jgi:UDP-2,3-diacylglucosamine hydrolase